MWQGSRDIVVGAVSQSGVPTVGLTLLLQTTVVRVHGPPV